ncbi:symplekin [Cotesia glomerata]|uniref:Symplekin n=1 Tax=Cotesia glomerata TaxID=32391 RepID=A0AAV7IC32_COTGL|nr:symplekin [Cotesia glomerata]KAH0548751.1 hypothetical protein KQX54_002088 [Cotesia glomerata]
MDPRLHRRAEPERNPRDTIVEWLNEATMGTNEVKVANLTKIQEYLINKSPQLMTTYLNEMLLFCSDRSADVRKTVAGFIEEAGDKTPDRIPQMLTPLLRLISDEVAAVSKRAVRASSRILRAALKWIVSSSSAVVTPEMETAWNQLSSLKAHIIKMIDSDNDGIRTQAVKFLEGVVLLQTHVDPDSPKRPDDFSLEDVPLTLKIARRRKLEEEANQVMDSLIKFHGSPHVSSVNLMACMGSLAQIAKMRPQFMTKVIEALQRLQSDLPPTLSDSQVTSVQKQLKTTLLALMKHPASIEHVQTIVKQLTQLGAKEQDIMKAYPKPEDIRRMKKRQAEAAAAASAAKRAKLETIIPTIPVEDPEPEVLPVIVKPELIELSESFIAERLSVEIATDLVLDSMTWVPDTMTAIFAREYQPSVSPDLQEQRQAVAKLLAAQIKQAKAKKIKNKDDDAVMEDLIKNPTITVAEAKRERKREKDREKEKEAKAVLEAEKSLAKRSRVKVLKLAEVTKPMSRDAKEKMLLMAVNRILRAEKSAIFGGVASARSKILTTLAATFKPHIREAVLRYISEDIRTRLDLALSWLYEEFALLQGFQRRTTLSSTPHEAPKQAYNFVLCTLVSAIDIIQGKDRDLLLSRLYFEAPLITDDAIEALKTISGDETRGLAPLNLLKEMVIRRPTKQLALLNVLLCHTGHEKALIREMSINLIVELYSRPELSKLIEEYAVMYLGFLRLPNPPEIVFGSDRGRETVEQLWSESTTRACLSLYLALLEKHQDLIHELARVYTSMPPDVKRIVLRLVENPVCSLGMASPQLLALVENCPKGAETLITRIIHILTERSPPSAELVSRVRELYQTRVSDVRFLIPVLNGLTKQEVIAALPKLIKLNNIVVKEVFNRLLGTLNNDTGVSHTSPLTPAELLIALHNIDSSKAELMNVIKATTLCFAEKQVFTQETLAVVIQHLVEINPLPTLLMRTVLQSLSSYPGLSGFVMNILQRLIMKQVWKFPKVWEGFVKCCQKLQPQSFAVVLQLPPQQLADAFKMSSGLKERLVSHIEQFTENQKAHISSGIMDVIQGKQVVDLHDDFDIAPPGDFSVDGKSDETPVADPSEPAPPGMD